MFINYIKKQAEQLLGQNVSKCIVTLPSFINNNNNYTNYITKSKKNADSYQQKSKFNSYLNINKSYANINQVKKVIKHSRSYINPNVRNGNGLNEGLVSYYDGNKKATVCNNNKKLRHK